MRVLLDECLPGLLKRHLPGHSVRTVPEEGWAGWKNGRLLRAAAGRFDAFVTVDAGILDQQNIRGLPLAVLILRVRSNSLESILPLVPRLLVALPGARQGECSVLSVDGT